MCTSSLVFEIKRISDQEYKIYTRSHDLTVEKMASQSTGIQQLLRAEKTAAEKVSEARKRKAKRLKQAKEEAQAEIEQYRAERERQYKKYEQSVLGSRGDMESKVEANTRVKLKEVEANTNKNKEAAIKKLLDMVLDIKPELHENWKK